MEQKEHESRLVQTPGPWRWEFMGNAGNYFLVGSDDKVTYSGPGSLDGKLMAAAPELLEACEKALDWINDFGMHSPTRFGGEAELAILLQKVIAKALGE